MSKEISEADAILVVCTEAYRERFNGGQASEAPLCGSRAEVLCRRSIGRGSYFSTSACSGNRVVLLLAALPLDLDAAAGAVGAGSFIPVS